MNGPGCLMCKNHIRARKINLATTGKNRTRTQFPVPFLLLGTTNVYGILLNSLPLLILRPLKSRIHKLRTYLRIQSVVLPFLFSSFCRLIN